VRHGTRHCYNEGCRCADCKCALRDYMRSLQGSVPPRHGTVSAYRNYGCRCGACKAAGSKANRAARLRRRVLSTPTAEDES
jgi:uncharacterized protein with PIN domain